MAGYSVEYVDFAVCAEGHKFRLRFGVEGPCVDLGPDGKRTVRCPVCKTDGWRVGVCHRDHSKSFCGSDVAIISEPLRSTRKSTRSRRTQGRSIPSDEFERIVASRFGQSAVQELHGESWHQ